MTDKKHFADEVRDHATDDDSPHAHQAPVRRRGSGTTISTTLTARWPTALALVQSAAAIAVIVLLGADIEFAPGIATMAGIYMVATFRWMPLYPVSQYHRREPETKT